MFRKPYGLWDNMEKYDNPWQTTDNIILRMVLSCPIPKATNTQSQYLIIITFHSVSNFIFNVHWLSFCELNRKMCPQGYFLQVRHCFTLMIWTARPPLSAYWLRMFSPITISQSNVDIKLHCINTFQFCLPNFMSGVCRPICAHVVACTIPKVQQAYSSGRDRADWTLYKWL